MQKILYLPQKLNLVDAFNFSIMLESLPDYNPIIFDFSKITRAFPFGSLFIASCINQLRQQRQSTLFRYSGIDVANNPSHGYLGHVGFFGHLQMPIGNEPGQAAGSQDYIPFTPITREEILAESLARGLHYGNIFIEKADKIATIIAHAFYPGDDHIELLDRYIFKFASYSIREILRNAFEHSNSDCIHIFAQRFQNIKVVEVSIVDEGIGIYRSLLNTHRPENIHHAIELALAPGVSSKLDHASDDRWGNSGFGLYTTSSLCNLYPRGAFAVASHNCAQSFYNKDKLAYFNNMNFMGTAIMLKFGVMEDYYFENILENIINEGEKKANINARKITASKMSRVVR